MKKDIILTELAPKPIGAYSQAVKLSSGLIMLSGQIGIDPKTGALVEGGIESEIKQVFDNIKAVLQAAAGTLGDVCKLTVFLQDIKHSLLVNKIMAELFQPPYPARSLMQVARLPMDAAIEIETIAVMCPN